MKKYKHTLNLPKIDFPIKLKPKHELSLLKKWDDEDLYNKMLQSRSNSEEFVLHDGPPYANGHLHYGHLLNKVLKDIVIKYNTLIGKKINFIPGWDCHGLPIEVNVDKKLGSKKHDMSKNELRKLYREYADKFVDIQREEFKRLGIVADWKNSYRTMDFGYETQTLEELAKFERAGLLYKGLKPVFWCPTHRTALANSDIEYKEDHASKSVFVLLRLVGHSNKYLAIWTTTPWTLLANKAVALNNTKTYAQVEIDNKRVWVAHDLVDKLSKKLNTQLVIQERPIIGSHLVGSKYYHPLHKDIQCPIVHSDHVTTDSGTGFVHIAPAHGEDDFAVGMKNNLRAESAINDNGKSEYELNINDTTDRVIDNIGDLVLLVDPVTHSYPYSTRSHRPVITKATEQWFINIDKPYNGGSSLRERALGALNEVKWLPEHGYNRIKKMLEGRPDWCISRQRSWGVPITIDGKQEQDILDVWFDSGVSNAVVMNSKQVDLYLEGSDQHRGWFQSTLLAALGANEIVPYKTVLTHGFVVDEKGEKLSKSAGNYVDPFKFINQNGAEVLRLWVASSEFKNDIRCSDEILNGVKKTAHKIRNTVRYMLAAVSDLDPKNEVYLSSVDKYILNLWRETFNSCMNAYEKYEFHTVVKNIEGFCILDLSSFYFEVVKDKLYCSGKKWGDRRAIQFVLKTIAKEMIQLMSPIMSFTMDEAWSHLEDYSVFTSVLPKRIFNPKEKSMHLIADMRELRQNVNVELEKLRQAGEIGSAIEANVKLTFTDSMLGKYNLIGLSDLFGVSNVYINRGNEVKIEVEKASLPQCQRCWQHRVDISAGKDLCGRCSSVLLGY